MINPKPEHRISFLEKQFIAMGGHLEGIQEDIETLDHGMKSSFDKIGDAFTLLDSNIEDVKATMATKDDISRLETAMATKDDLTAMQGQIKQDTGTIETRLDRMESDITSMKTTQEQILKLLQQRPSE
jgi:flagellar capping protein FliD